MTASTRAIQMKSRRQIIVRPAPAQENGFSLIEFMIAITLGLIIVAALTAILTSNMTARNELAKSNMQIENGRYAIDMLREDIRLAGFYGEYYPTGSTAITWSTPDPCATALDQMGFAAPLYSWNTSSNVILPVGLHGFTGSDTTPSCLTNRKSGTDILVVHRLGTTIIPIDTDQNHVADANVTVGTSTVAYSSLGTGYYMQMSHCTDVPPESAFVMDHDTSKFTMHNATPTGTPPNCMNSGFSSLRKYVVRIFYIADCDDCSGSGDGIPTLKMAELSANSSVCATSASTACGTFTITPVAEGIENMQLEYGIDSAGTGTPASFSAAPAATDWQNVIAVKIFLLARNTEKTIGYTDSKTYSLSSDGMQLSGTPFNDNYRRHVYAVSVRANNIANRR
jgi:type IV pilus assembly protein PilW